MTDAPVQNSGTEFDDVDVARSYGGRAPYPPALLARVAELSPAHGRALDLGCGTGKLAGALARRFREVIAVDPAEPMLTIARAEHPQANIRWINGFSENVEIIGPFDLAVAGASIHWMRHGVVFPKLAELLGPDAPIVIVEGDGPAEAPWMDTYRAVLVRWVERLGGVWNSPEFVARARGHEAWIDILGRESFPGEHRARLEDLIDGEHSRATWTRAKMGPLAEAFDADLRAVLTPHAEDGWVSFQTRTVLLWGRPRRTPKA